MRHLKHLPIYLGVVAAGFGYQVQAQQSIAEGVGSLSVEEIIVTARKTEESIQDIPFSIQAVSETQIAERDYRGLADIARTTPGFTFESFATSGATSNAVIRGLTNTFTTSRIQNVSVFLNGVYLQRQGMINSGLLDMQRVEVLKGPQSALFGRNAFAGAINYITQTPSDVFGGKVYTTIGSNERIDVGGSITGPIIEDKLLGKFTYAKSDYDGGTKNDHIYHSVNAYGPSTQDNLGGWDNESFSTGLVLTPRDDLSISSDWYHTDMSTETAAFYTLKGARNSQTGLAASGCPAGTPDDACTLFTPGFSADNIYAVNDLNYNPVALPSGGFQSPIPYAGTGNTLWKGKLKYQAPGTDGFYVDPRSNGTAAKTDIVTLRADWDINDDWTSYYLYGYADNQTYTSGAASGYGGSWFTNNVDLNAFSIQRLKAQPMNGAPNATLRSDSHEVRFEWAGNDLISSSFGLFYSDVKDSDYSLFNFMSMCAPGYPRSNCMENVGLDMPTVLSPQGFSWNLAYQAGKKSAYTKYNDKIYSGFGTLNFTLTEDITWTLEGRYTQEDKSVKRITDVNGVEEGGYIPNPAWFNALTGSTTPLFSYANSGTIPSDQEDYFFFAPRTSINWQVAPDNLVYFTIAKGEKTGGFNNDATIPTYDPETNWTYEIGSKNTFLDNTLIVNGSLYYVDWRDIQGQGSVAAAGGISSPFTPTPTTNIGNARNLGIEVDAQWNMTEHWSFDGGFSMTNPYYTDDTIYADAINDPVNGIYGNFECNGQNEGRCPTSGIVDGNQVARTSRNQAFWGANYQTVVLDGWGLTGRLSGAYQSKQYVEPLNLGYVPSRVVYDANITMQAPNNWEFTLWGKNIFNREYASAAFVVSQFNQYIVNAGDARSYGATITYNF